MVSGKGVSVVTEVGEIVLIEAEMMANFVEEGDPDFLVDGFLLIVVLPAAGGVEDSLTEEADIGGKVGGVFDGTLSESDAAVEATEGAGELFLVLRGVGLFVLAEEGADEFGVGAVVDDDGDFLEEESDRLGEVLDGFLEEGIESFSVAFGHGERIHKVRGRECGWDGYARGRWKESYPMDLEQRIAQFENMAQADPENEMAHFSLANAYAQAGRHGESAASYLRATEAQPDLSKAYQLAGEQFLASGDRGRAIEVWMRGYEVAAKNGDLMPRRAMQEALEREGAALPEVEGLEEVVVPEGAFVCSKTGRAGHQLDRPPFKGPVGAWIYENISSETWNAWIAQGTKVINELRLDLSRDQDSETYDRYMHEYLGLDDGKLEEIRMGAGRAG